MTVLEKGRETRCCMAGAKAALRPARGAARIELRRKVDATAAAIVVYDCVCVDEK